MFRILLCPDESIPLYFEYELRPTIITPKKIPNKNGTFLCRLPWNNDGVYKSTIHATILPRQKESGSTITGWKAEFFIPYKLLAPWCRGPCLWNKMESKYVTVLIMTMGRPFCRVRKQDGPFHQYEKFERCLE